MFLDTWGERGPCDPRLIAYVHELFTQQVKYINTNLKVNCNNIADKAYFIQK